MPYETLQERGMFGVRESIAFATLAGDEGDGYTPSAAIGSSCGTRDWSLTWSVLPQNSNGQITYRGLGLSRADYLWEFYCQRMREGNSSFIIESPVNNQYYLACFADTRLTYELISVQLFSTGVQIKQRREPGVTVFDPRRAGTLWGWYDASQETDFDDDDDVDVISDFSGNGRHLLVADEEEQAKYKTNIVNGNPVFRWGADNEIKYRWLAEAPDQLALKHAFVITKASEATFSAFRGLLTASTTSGLLIGNNGTDDFFNFGFTGDYEYRLNNVIYPQSGQTAPMNEFGVIAVSLDPAQTFTANTLQIGADRDFSDRHWLGDLPEILIFSNRLRQSTIEEIIEYGMVKYGVS